MEVSLKDIQREAVDAQRLLERDQMILQLASRNQQLETEVTLLKKQLEELKPKDKE